MGGGSSSNKTSTGDPERITIQPTLPGYAYPEPPTTCVDDVRSPIPWYREETNDDEFDWAVLERERSYIEEKATYNNADKANHASVITPHSVIRPTTVMTVPLTNRKLRTTSGRVVSFVNHSRSRVAVASRSSSRMSAGVISMRGVKLQEVPAQSQLRFDKIDAHARKAKGGQTKTFTALADYLKQPTRYHRRHELLTARALIIWLAFQKIKKSFMGKSDLLTPKGLINSLAQGTISFAEAYTVLCREAGLQCVLVDGVTKLHGYEPGDTDNGHATEDTWVAVYVEGTWQIVHPNYICQGLLGTSGSFDDWIRREIENEGSSRPVAIKFLKSLVKDFFNEDYFMPMPEVFIHTCYADDNRWQLLPPQYVVRSRDVFLALPYIFPAFFKLGFKFMSEPNCVLESSEGVCRLWIDNDQTFAHKLVLDFDLSLTDTDCPDVDHVIDNLRRLVVLSRQDKYFYIELRFPFEGVFKLELKGGFYGSHIMRLCHFRLVCPKRLNTFKYVPFEPEDMMWGPGPATQLGGLGLPSMPTGVIHFHPHRKTPVTPGADDLLIFPRKVVSFLVDPDVGKHADYSCTLFGYTSDDFEPDATPLDINGNLKTLKELKRYRNKRKKGKEKTPKRMFDAECIEIERIVQERQLDITVGVPHEGEFALIVFMKRFVRMKDGTKRYEDPSPVCCYLLRTINDPHKENVPQRLARSQLDTVMLGNSITAIRNSADKCLRLKIPETDDEVVAARTKYEYLSFKKDMNDALHRRNLRIVNDSLRKVSTYRHKNVLQFKIRLLFKLRLQLKRLSEFKDDIPALVDAGQEIVQMVQPPPEIHLTMAALFMVLEEPEKNVESWDYIVQRMSSDTVPEDAPIFRKMHLISEMYPSKNTRRKINTLLEEYGLDMVRGASVAAARFYRWVSKVMAVLQDEEFRFDEDPDLDKEPENPLKRANGTIPDVEVT